MRQLSLAMGREARLRRRVPRCIATVPRRADPGGPAPILGPHGHPTRPPARALPEHPPPAARPGLGAALDHVLPGRPTEQADRRRAEGGPGLRGISRRAALAGLEQGVGEQSAAVMPPAHSRHSAHGGLPAVSRRDFSTRDGRAGLVGSWGHLTPIIRPAGCSLTAGSVVPGELSRQQATLALAFQGGVR